MAVRQGVLASRSRPRAYGEGYASLRGPARPDNGVPACRGDRQPVGTLSRRYVQIELDGISACAGFVYNRSAWDRPETDVPRPKKKPGTKELVSPARDLHQLVGRSGRLSRPGC